MQYAFFGTAGSESLDRFAKLIGAALEGVGFTSTNGDAADANLVISLLDLEAPPRPFRRRGKGTYVVGLFERAAHPDTEQAGAHRLFHWLTHPDVRRQR